MTTPLGRPLYLLPTLLATLLAVGCGDDAGVRDAPGEPLIAFDTATVRIESGDDTMMLTVELAETDDQRAYGLMERDTLAPDRGMLFVYPAARDSSRGFWMYRTWIPLDIAFLDADGRILDIRQMQPCESPNPRVCRLYSPGVAYRGALEVNRGWFAEHGVEVGDRVTR